MSQATAMPQGNFSVTPYKPDGGFTASGVVLLLTSLTIIGAALGFAAHFISNFFYLILIFPILIGLALGFIGGKMVKQGRVRNPWIGAAAGFLGGVFAMAMMHYFDYTEYRKIIATKVEDFEEVLAMPQEQLQANVPAEDVEGRQFLEFIDAARSFPKFIDFSAVKGVEISSTRGGSSSNKPLNLGYIGSYIYWIIEILIVAGITLFMVRDEAAAPFCPACSDWKKPTTLGGIAGDLETAKSGVMSGDVARIAQAAPTADITDKILYASICPHCNGAASAIDLKLSHFTTNSNGKAKENKVAQASWPVAAMPALQSLFVPAAPSVADPSAPPTPPPVPPTA